MSRESAVSAIERGDLSELQHVLEESEWDIGSEPLDSIGQTALHIACTNGHLDIVQYLVNKKGCSVTVEDVYGHTPLILSLINKHWKMANFLLQFAPDSFINDLVSSYNMSIVMKVAKEALAASCKEGYFELVKYLIKSGWHIVDHKEIINSARCFDNLHIVKYLLTHCQCTIPDDMSEVHIACIQGVVEKVKKALDSNGSSLLGTADDFGTTPIHYATLEPNLLRMVVQYAGEMLLNITDSRGNTPLHHSIKYECIESVTILAEAPGCDVNIANLKGETPLIAACKYSNINVLQLCVASERCDLNICDSEGNTALHIAISVDSSCRLEYVQCLLQSDRCDPNVINKSGSTPLHIVCHQGEIPLLKALVADKKCDLNIQDGNGDTALHIGVDNVEVVRCLLESGCSRCDIYNEEGLTPFHKAIVNGVMASVEVMLKNGVNILQTSNDKFQNAPIHIACEHTRLDTLKVLLGCANCDPNQQNAVGDTALHIVCKTGRELESLELQCILQSNRCDPNVINKSGSTPLHTVCHQGEIPLLEALVADKRCDLNIQDGNGDTALHIGVENVEVVKCLLESGRSRCDIYNEKGLTPFHEAIVSGVMASVEVMLKNGVNILQTSNDIYRYAPIHIACVYSKRDILKFFLCHTNCDPNQQNAEGDTALHIVCRMRTGSELQFFELLTFIGINPTLVNHEGIAPCDVVGNDGNTLLHIACAEGNTVIVELLLNNGAGILKPDRNGDAPIHIACRFGRLSILKILLGCTNCDPNQQNAEGNTPLHIVCRIRTGRELQFLELLISTPGINPTIVNHEGIVPFEVVGNDGNTLLHIACAEGNAALLKFLMKKGVDIQKSNGQGDAPIHIACKCFQLNSLKAILGSKDCDPNQQNAEGNTALHIMCRKRTGCELEFLELLTSTPGINPTIVNHEGDAPIHIACINSKLQSLIVLLSCESCDPNQRNTRGDTALHIVCGMRTGDVLQIFELLTSTPGINSTLVNTEGIAPCDVVGDDGNTLLHIACAEENSKTVEFLVKNGVDVMKPDRHGDAPIHITCKHSRLDVLRVLLACTNCDPNQWNAEGDTALHIVCRMRTGNELQIFELLTSTPGIKSTLVNTEGIAPCDVVGDDGNTLLHIACAEENSKTVEFLVKNGVDVMKPDRHGDAPIHITCKHSRLDVLRVLLAFTNCDPNQWNAEGDTALHIVCRMRTGSELQFVVLQCLLQSDRCDPNVINKSGHTPLHIVCHRGDIPLLEVLVADKRCDLNIQDGNGDTALHIGVENVEVVKCLLESGRSRCDIYNKKGLTSFHKAITNGIMPSVEVMMKNRENILQTTSDDIQNAPIHIACIYSRLDILKFLLGCTNCHQNQQNVEGDKYLQLNSTLGSKDCNPNQQNDEGNTALHIVCGMRTGSELQFLKVLTSTPGINLTLVNHEGIVPCDVVGNDGNTLLHNACAEGNTALVEFLMKKGVDIQKSNGQGDAPIHITCKCFQLNSLNVILGSKDCDPNQQNAEGNTALHIVCRMRTGSEIQFLEVLTSTPGINSTIVNHEGIVPFEVVDRDGNTLLHNACVEGNIRFAELLLKYGTDVFKLNRCGDAPIHVACKHSRLEVLKPLFASSNCNPDQLNADGDTALHIVCRKGGNSEQRNEISKIVEFLVNNGADILKSDRNEDAPIHIACKFGRLSTLKVLLGCTNCDPNQQNAEGDTPLHIVCRMRTGNELQFLALLTSTPGINPTLVNHEGIAPCDVVGNDGSTLLHIACAEGNTVIVELLLNNGADILKPHRNEDAPIHIACKFGRLSTLKVLLGCTNCDPNQQNAEGNTALHIVCRMRTGRELQFLELLTSTPGINPTLVNHEGDAPIHTACMNFKFQSLIVLLSCESCDPNQQNSKGDTALHIVCRMRTGSELQFLALLTSTPGINPTLVNHEGIAPCDVVGNDGSTLLHIACAEGNTVIVELLLNNGADILKPHRNEDAPIHIACKFGRLSTLKVLWGHTNCDPNQQNAEGNTALHIVCRKRTGRELQFLEVLTSTPGINLTLVNHEGDAPIHTACMNFEFQSLKVILSCKNCDPNQQNSKGDTALHIVCRMRTGRELQFLALLTSTPGINPTLVNHEGIAPCDVVGIHGNTLLHIACAEGNTVIIELLLNNGADILKPDRHGDAPIHIACRFVRPSTLKVLLGCTNCDPNQQNAEGNTALHIVCRKRTGRELQFFEVLTSTPGINPTLVNHEGDAPIHTACMNFKFQSLIVLLSCESCDPNQQNSKGDTALHIVCRMRTGSELQFLELLTSAPGINPTLVNHEGIGPFEVVGNDGNTLLHNACAEGNTALVEFLMKKGVDIQKPNGQGDAPIHVACKCFQLNFLKAILGSKDCDPNQQNAEGNTALHIVCRMRTGSEIQFLEMLTSAPGINPTIVNHEGIVPFEVVDRDGNTLLHNACIEGNIRIAELLLKYGTDVFKLNRCGDAPIHVACKHSRLEVLKPLFTSSNCNPDQLNADGDTALHIVCRKRGSNEEKNNISKIVEFLVKNGADLLKPDRYGDAPIHTACQLSRLDILKILLESRDYNPNQQNGSGDTAMHIVCRMSRGSKLPFLKMLLSTPGINPEIVNHEGHTPIEVAGTNYFAIDAIKKFLEHKKSSIQAYLKIFVVGNSGNGKSTLIKAITTEASQLRKYTPLSKMKYVNPSDVPPHTAGIVPIPFNSKHFGNAVLYDFAGQHEYYSSHAAVMENLILPSPPLFLLLINISKSKEVIREELVYWWHFINNQSQKAAAPPHVILAGSHKDMVKSSDREELETMLRECIKHVAVTFKFVGYFPLDCRKLVSRDLSALLTKLNTTCQTLRQIVDATLHCHILNALLKAPEFQDAGYCEAIHIMNRIESDDALLPKNVSQLISLLASLNDQGHILLLKNHTDESKSWVILKPDVLFSEVNGRIFAPKYFKGHSEFAISTISCKGTGVVTLSKLKEKFTEYNHEVIVAYLTHLEFCFRIKDKHILAMITKYAVYESATTEEYYFFPALVNVENPTDVCQPHQSIGYECGWLYKCSKETEQLTTRFLHVLILRLAFACDPPDDPTDTESVVLLRKCSVWKHGIAWWTNDGIEVIVEVGLQCRWVAVMLRCPDDKKVECAELRSKVIHTVLKAKTDFCPAITMREYLIGPSSLKYPFEGRELTLYHMREVAAAVIEGKDYARDAEGKNPTTIPQLLPFEPYRNMENLVPKFFSGDSSVPIKPEELTQLAGKCHDKLAELKTAFKPDVGSFQRECVKADCTEVERCVALFHILQKRGRFKTWRDFQQEFSRFTIFCEQSPLVRMMSIITFSPINCKK